MSFIYTVSLPENKLDRRDRVAAPGYIKLDREGEKYLNDIAAKLKTADISSVFASDTNSKAAEYIARRMGIPVWVTRKLRGFNFGRFGGHSKTEVSAVLEGLLRKWEANETVPIVGGDSWTSYRGRFLKEMLRIVQAPNSVNVLLLLSPLDHAVWSDFAKGAEHLRRSLFKGEEFKGKILKTRTKDGHAKPTEPVPGRSERPADVGRSVPAPDINVGGAKATDGIVRTPASANVS